RSLLDWVLGGSLWRSPTRTEIDSEYCAWRFAFQRDGNARLRENGKALRFSDRHKLFGTSRSDHPTMRSLFGRCEMHAARRDLYRQRGVAAAGRELARTA